MGEADQRTTAQLVAEGRALVPWHLLVEVTEDVTTRDFAEAPYAESFGRVALLDPRDRFTATLKKLYPNGLEARSVLDCACNCGGYLFWAKDLGAGHCHGIDVRAHWIDQAHFLTAHRTLPKDDMRFEVLDLYDLQRQGLEGFDVVLFNGIFYHLPDPIAGLKIAADLTHEVLIINTSTTISLPDGQLAVAGESITRAVSGIYGLNWFPTGPEVLMRLLGWLGFTEVRTNWWLRLPGQRAGHARLELVASRDASALAHFDAVEQQEPLLSRIVETTVPPEATVLVAGPDGDPTAFDGRTGMPFPEDGEGSAGDRRLIEELVRLRGEGAGYLLIPHAAAAWFNEHPDLQRHVHSNYKRMAREPDVGVLFSLLPFWQTK